MLHKGKLDISTLSLTTFGGTSFVIGKQKVFGTLVERTIYF